MHGDFILVNLEKTYSAKGEIYMTQTTPAMQTNTRAVLVNDPDWKSSDEKSPGWFRNYNFAQLIQEGKFPLHGWDEAEILGKLATPEGEIPEVNTEILEDRPQGFRKGSSSV